ncbi:MAG: tRNA 2-thiouridine(34) synthase MnmA [Bacteroidetes bacterium GWA2_31_9]|nr:MAG: tRNA 2-thiouridine(34) synthase MnmA [Bacteroidetes bacterium GWA2_31_9]
MSKDRVLVAMSGGIDSSITALLLKELGYDIVGITLKTWEYSSTCSTGKETGCCSIDSFNDARDLAVQIGFPHYIIDVQKEFNDLIINDFIQEYMHGRTPNPCVNCNTYIKWDYLLKKANQLNCKFIATGHYAQIKSENGRFYVSKGKDEKKDQSYVLWGLSQESLSRTILPLGQYHKSEIKQLAADRGFKSLSEKRESYEICFVPDNEYRDFLKSRNPELEKTVADGNFVDSKGIFLGKHKGFPFYTIGQRKGLDIAVGHPLYVVKIDYLTNSIVLGTIDELKSSNLKLENVNFLKETNLSPEKEYLTKIRYKDVGTKCKIIQENNSLNIHFLEPVSSITSGQSAVIYDGDDVIAGGVIC